jgi:ribosome-associated protein
MRKDITLQEPTIRLGQFLKLAGLVATGGEAKNLIQSGAVLVNDQVEMRRKRQLRDGDMVTVGDETIVVEFEPDPESSDQEERA